MNPFSFFLLAILTPFAFCLTLLAPLYLSVYAAVYVVYSESAGAHLLLSKFFDIFYICGTYSQLYDYWDAHMMQVSFVYYTVPVIIVPFCTVFLAMWLTKKLFKKLGDIFMISVGSE